MKRIPVLILAFLTLVGFSSCSSDDDVVFITQADPEGVSFKNTFSSVYVLTGATADNIAERFVWNELELDVPTNVIYELQASTTPTFDDYSVVGSSSTNNVAVTVKQMMSLAKDAGLDNDPATEAPNTGNLYFRLVASAGTAGELAHTSEVKTLTVLLPEATDGEVELPKIYMVGNFLQASGYGSDWTPADAVPLAASDEGATDYEGFVYINVENPEFKFLPTNEGWDGDYGDAGTTAGGFTGKLVQEGEVNAGTPDGTGGYYWVKVDLDKLTYSLTKVDWGIIGNATPTGWDSDTDMVYNPETKLWTLTLNLTEQVPTDNGLKFRANDAWAINLGDTGADGILEFGGDNIGVPESGNYTVTLDLSNPRTYTYSLVKN